VPPFCARSSLVSPCFSSLECVAERAGASAGLGSAILERFRPVLLLFAGILLSGSFKILAGKEEDEEEGLEDNAVVRFVSSLLPVTSRYYGDSFFALENGVRTATPLLLVLATVELSDLVFAVDSIPAVFGVTQDPFIVYTSNMFAIASLRSLFAIIAVKMGELEYLEKAVAVVLAFIGCKMVLDVGLDIEIPTSASLLVVVAALTAGVGLSLAKAKDEA
jgi:TerC family integral membrane protein